MAENFTPGETISLTATTSSSSASFTLTQSANYPDCLVTNAGSQIAFVGFGTGTASLPGAGVVNATPIGPGESLLVRKGLAVTQCNAITPSGSTQLYFTAGQGS